MAARPRGLSRRGLLTGAATAALLTSCAEPQAPSARKGTDRLAYGDDSSQFAELRMPKGDPLATVVLLHGGFWLGEYHLDLMDPLAERFTDLGFATWNVEYRGIGAGGGYPSTLVDVALAVDRLAGSGLPAGLTTDVVLVGHSAGGHLAAWAASRTRRTAGGGPRVRPRGAVSLGGLLDLTGAGADPSTAEGVAAFLGGPPTGVPERYAFADPTLLVPAACPVWAVAARDDTTVPADQSATYVARAKAAGGTAELVEVPGDHFSLIDPDSSAFPTLRKLVARASA